MLDGLLRTTNSVSSDGDQTSQRFVLTEPKNATGAVVFASVIVGRRSWSASRAACIVNDTTNIIRIDRSGTSILVIKTQKVVTDFLVGLNDDLIALTDVDTENGGLVWLDWDEIGGDNSEFVSVNIKFV